MTTTPLNRFDPRYRAELHRILDEALDRVERRGGQTNVEYGMIQAPHPTHGYMETRPNGSVVISVVPKIFLDDMGRLLSEA